MAQESAASALPPAYLLSPGEEERLASFFRAGTLPPVLEAAVEGYVTKKTGRDWRDPVILDRLRRAVVLQKDAYWKPAGKRFLHYTKAYSVLAYLAYHFPVYFMQTEHLLAMLARDGLLRERMTILDIGTGPGVVPLAAADFWSRLDRGSAGVYSVERSEEHSEAFLFLRDRFVPRGGKVSVKPPAQADIAAPIPGKVPEKADLIVFSNVLNELDDRSPDRRADIVMRYAERLAPDGTILIAEPAEETVSTQLRVLSLALKKRGLTIHSPCSFIRQTNCTPDRCWSFSTAPRIRPTRIMETLAACGEPFRYINTDIKYSYVVLRKDGRTRHSCRVSAGSRALRLAGIHRHTGRRVNLIAARMSENIGDAKTMMFRLCDGTAATPVFAVLPSFHVTPGNACIVSAPYGAILDLRGVLVRRNEARDSYNVLVSRNTEIRLVPEHTGT